MIIFESNDSIKESFELLEVLIISMLILSITSIAYFSIWGSGIYLTATIDAIKFYFQISLLFFIYHLEFNE